MSEVVQVPVASASPTHEPMDADASPTLTPVAHDDKPLAVHPSPPSTKQVADSSTPSAALPTNSPSPPPSAAPTPAPPSEVDIEALAAKKRRIAQIADEGKKRSKRMFGLVQSTLMQAKQDGAEGKMSGAALKRKELEERLQKKLETERSQLEEKQKRDREGREVKLSVIKKEEEINTAESLYRTRHDAKLNLAAFLCTSFTLPAPPPASDGISVPFLPRLPHSLRITHPTAPRPLYYLPYRLLASQEDQIEDQIADAKKAIKNERLAWEDKKGDKQGELEKAKRRRDELADETERREREERQKRRRQEEEREEAKSKDLKANQMDEDKPVVNTAEKGPEVVSEEPAEEVKTESASISIKGSAPETDAVEAEGDGGREGEGDTKMEGVEGEDELEVEY